jgi:hypothetical protein
MRVIRQSSLRYCAAMCDRSVKRKDEKPGASAYELFSALGDRNVVRLDLLLERCDMCRMRGVSFRRRTCRIMLRKA